MTNCTDCGIVMEVKVHSTADLDSIRDALLCLEDILQSMEGFEEFSCSGRHRPRFDELTYRVYGSCPVSARREAWTAIRDFVDGRWGLTVSAVLDPCRNCECKGMEALGKR